MQHIFIEHLLQMEIWSFQMPHCHVIFLLSAVALVVQKMAAVALEF
jgi:hypothetical protein